MAIITITKPFNRSSDSIRGLAIVDMIFYLQRLLQKSILLHLVFNPAPAHCQTIFNFHSNTFGEYFSFYNP